MSSADSIASRDEWMREEETVAAPPQSSRSGWWWRFVVRCFGYLAKLTADGDAPKILLSTPDAAEEFRRTANEIVVESRRLMTKFRSDMTGETRALLDEIGRPEPVAVLTHRTSLPSTPAKAPPVEEPKPSPPRRILDL